MKFVNREQELLELKNYYGLSRKRLFPVVIYGIRRIGKTELIKYFTKDKDGLYFFVYSKKTQRSLLKEFESELKRYGVLSELERIDAWSDFLNVLFERCEDKIIIFDEFQNFGTVYPAIFSMLQRKIDESKGKNMMVVFLGSIIGLIKKVFEETKAPLYGRIKVKIKLGQLKYRDARELLKEVGYRDEEDFVKFYAIFGGIPKYYVGIEDFELNGRPLNEIIGYLFLRDNAPFGYEVIDILRQEFGKRKGTYYTVLEAIATGHTKLNEIATYVGLSINSIGRHLYDLMDYYEIVERITPITEGRRSKKGRYKISDPVVNFWFRYIQRHITLFEGKRYEELGKIIFQDLNSYIGRNFERVCKEFLVENNIPFTIGKIGSWYGYYKDGLERKASEIDLVALNDKTKEMAFFECKWSSMSDKDAERILADLERKAELVQWHNAKRKEHYGIIAKAIANKKKLREKGYLAFDLEDFRALMR